MSFQKKGSCTATTASTATRPLAGKKSPPPTLTPNSKGFHERLTNLQVRVDALESRNQRKVLRDLENVIPSPKNLTPSQKDSSSIPAYQRLYEQGTEKIKAIRTKAALNSPPLLKSESKKTPSPRSTPQTKTPTVRSNASTPRTPYTTPAHPHPFIEENVTPVNTSVEASIPLETQASSLEVSTTNQQVSTSELQSNNAIHTLEPQVNTTASTTVQTQANTSAKSSTVFETQASIPLASAFKIQPPSLEESPLFQTQAISFEASTTEQANTSIPLSKLIVFLHTIQGTIAHFQSLEKVVQLLIDHSNSPSTSSQQTSDSSSNKNENKKEKVHREIQEVEKDIEVLNSEIDKLKNNNDNSDRIESGKLTSDSDSICNNNDNGLSNHNNSFNSDNNNNNSKDDQTTAVSTIEKEKHASSYSVANQVVEPCIGFHKTALRELFECTLPSTQDKCDNGLQSVAVPVDPQAIEPVRFQKIVSTPPPQSSSTTFVEEGAKKGEAKKEAKEEAKEEPSSQVDSHCPSFFNLLDELEADRISKEKAREKEKCEQAEKCLLSFFTPYVPDPSKPLVIRKPLSMWREEIEKISEYRVWLKQHHAERKRDRRELREARERIEQRLANKRGNETEMK